MADTSARDPETWPAPIIAAVDGSQMAYRAVAWAAAEAELRRWPLHIVVAYGVEPRREKYAPVTEAEREEFRWAAEDILAEAIRVARDVTAGADVSITTEAIDAPALTTLVEMSATARMIVVGNRGRGTMRRALLGSVSAGLARRAHCPVTVVHDSTEAGVGASGRPVVVGVDGTENSMPAVETAFEEASRRKAPLLAVHAWRESSGFDLEVVGWETIRRREDRVLAESLAGFGERFPEVAVERVVTCDTPVHALLEHTEDAQLLVVGSRGRGGFAGLVLGSVSIAMLHAATCPVLVVRSEEKEIR
ncbi:universal stress protein [Nocardia seriolae]|uniref:universal stress protein n=1 Tax=Nocardia seriolae TaxID=37332 RepID=UPI000EF27D95|nr:universal stress protein [Nocardia seriolae]RLP30455.1 universal stress protein [Nocardia seriolae]WKY55350.1 universal stress protein [Nocardia seriolae]